jgi:exonuclease VII small subunit
MNDMPKKEVEFSLTEKLAELEKIEKYFEQADLSSIDDALKKHAEALAIAKEIHAYLDTAESSLSKLDPTRLKENRQQPE